MRWRKLGLVFRAFESKVPWIRSHGQLPVADRISSHVYRVYFAGRSAEQVSRIGAATVEMGERVRLLDLTHEPILEPGGIGTFDEHGVFPACIVNMPDRKRMYYIGWNRGYRAPLFYASIGLAESTDGGSTWRKHSPAPIMSRSMYDPCLVTSPHVLWHEGRYRMTYVSGIAWSESGETLKSHYHIKYAESDDGLVWRRSGIVAIDFSDQTETNVARSWVLVDGERLRMWFGYVRGNTPYRIGYAESDDYMSWRRNDSDAGIGVSESGWDSEMICYPNVVVHEGRAYMFYNGNAFGRDGFGAAVSDYPFQ